MRQRRDIHLNLTDQNGFSLAELLLAILILLMVTTIVAGGIPVAARAYYKVIDASNAQVLLSTTLTKLRDELGTASEITIAGTNISYRNEAGSKSRIYLDESTGIWIQEYDDPLLDIPDGKGSTTEGAVTQADLNHLLVSYAASNKNLIITYGDVSAIGGIVEFNNIEVKKEGQTQAIVSIQEFKIRELTAISEK